MYSQPPIIILNVNTKREHGRTAQLSNIKAGKVGIINIGGFRYSKNNLRSKINVENVDGSHGRNCNDK